MSAWECPPDGGQSLAPGAGRVCWAWCASRAWGLDGVFGGERTARRRVAAETRSAALAGETGQSFR